MDTTTAEQLLEHSGWARALARRLLRDPQLADDVTQEAWLRALRRPGLRIRSPRAWLGTVVRRLASSARRGDKRRTRREEIAATPEAEPATDELVARAEAHKRVVAAVLALEEPYRATLLRRYFDGDTAAAIARAEGVPAATVRGRLRRAHDLLRGRLDREFGGRPAWCAALVLLARGPAGVLGPRLKVGLALVTILVSCGLLWRAYSGAREGRPGPRGTADRTAAPDEGTGAPADTGASAQIGPAELPEESRVRVAGLVVDASGAPVDGATVLALARDDLSSAAFDDFRQWIDAFRSAARAKTPVARTTTDSEGRFGLEIGDGDVFVTASADGHGPATPLDVPDAAAATRVVLRLTAGTEVSGRILSEAGEPVAGARVRAWPKKRRAMDAAAARSEADGTFVLPGVPAGGMRLLCEHPDYLAVLVARVTAPARDVAVVLEKGAVLRGIVRDADLRPLSGVAVTVFGIGMAPGVQPIAATTGADGRFAVRVPRLAQFSVLADAGARGRALQQAVHWEDRWRVEEIVLMTPRTIAGRVVLEDGTGVAGVAVRVWDVYASSGAGRRGAVSGPDGGFRIEGVYSSTVQLADDVRFELAGPIEPGAEGLAVRVAPRASISGRVVDAEGRPANWVEVECDEASGRAFTDAAGCFTLFGVRSGATRRGVSARALDGRRGRLEPLRLGPGEQRTGLEIVLRAASAADEAGKHGPGAVRGRVLDDSDQPLNGVKVIADRVQRIGTNTIVNRLADAETGADGTYELRGLGTEVVRLRFRHPGYADGSLSGVLPSVDGTRVDDVRLAGRAVLRGRVERPDGAPVANARVLARRRGPDPAVYTNARGEFALRGLDGDSVSLKIYRHGYRSATVAQPLPAQEVVRIVLEPRAESGLSISGVVLDAAGKRLPLAGVTAMSVADGRTTFRGRTGMQGRFLIPGLPAGRYELHGSWHYAVGRELDPFVFAPITVAAGTDNAVVRLVRGLSITGRVVAPSGTDFAETTVEAVFARPPIPRVGGRRSAQVGPDGRFRIPGLVSGSYRLELRSKSLLARPLPAVAAGTEDAEFVSGRGLAIAGLVVAADGSVPAGAKLRLSRTEPRGRWRARPDAAGTFRIDGLAPGAYELQLIARGRIIRRRVEAGNTNVRFVLPE